jgi:multiple sugar transport system permease protein
VEEGTAMSQSKKVNKVISTIIIQAVLICFSIVMIVPFAWMVLTSFKTVTEATSINPFVIFPKVWKTDAFVSVWKNMSFPLLYKNTFLLVFWRVVCACLTATFSGYAFARLKFPGKNIMFALVLIQIMIPGQIFTIPQYIMISKLNMTNTMFALVFPGFVTASGTFLLRQAYMQLPKDLEEASRLDGCNIPQTFIFIMAPLARSSMVALGIFTAVSAYKALLWPLVVCTDEKKEPLAAALATMQGNYSTNYPELMAASLIACIPMIILYLIFQKQFIQGIATSGTKL